MTKKHWKSINGIIGQLEKLQAEVDALRDKLQEKYDGMSDNQQESDYGDDLQDVIDSLESASFDGLALAVDELRNAAMYLETLPVQQPMKTTRSGSITLPLAAGMIHWEHKRSAEELDEKKMEPPYDPYDNHWETSFDWVDEDNDGYDDRDIGF